MGFSVYIYPVLLLGMLSPVASMAEEVPIRLDGFTSFVGGALIGDEPFHTLGYDEDLRFDQHSLIATQIHADMGQGLSATTQFLGEAINRYEVEVEWAFLDYEISPHWSAKLGRVRAPLYMYSEHLDVGYAYHWIRPPPILYDLPFDNLQGFQIEYLADIGSWNSRIDLTAGTTTEDYLFVDEETEVELREAVGSSWTLNYNWLTLRLAYAETGRVNIPSSRLYNPNNLDDPNTLNGNLRALAQAAGESPDFFDNIVNEIRINEDRARFGAFGLMVEQGNYLLAAEYTHVDLDHSISPDQDNYYLSIGRYFNRLLLHLTYAVDDEPAKQELAQQLSEQIPAGFEAPAAPLVALVDSAAIQLASDSEVWSIGARYDFHRMAAFKVEYHYQDNHLTEEKAELLLFAVDAIF